MIWAAEGRRWLPYVAQSRIGICMRNMHRCTRVAVNRWMCVLACWYYLDLHNRHVLEDLIHRLLPYWLSAILSWFHPCCMDKSTLDCHARSTAKSSRVAMPVISIRRYLGLTMRSSYKYMFHASRWWTRPPPHAIFRFRWAYRLFSSIIKHLEPATTAESSWLIARYLYSIVNAELRKQHEPWSDSYQK